ncbi:hypothetical protein GF312_08585, partial [Candidatus Poribacteria bacterium]|nr:hypothetical protein [Candidatus Poribacteria bacterium]
MKEYNMLFILLTLLVFTTGSEIMSSEISDNSVKFYVSPNGKDSNPGTDSMPFATIQKAREAVRKEISEGLTSHVLVIIRGGDYYLDKPLMFNQQDSGDEEHSVTYKAESGQQVRIIGGTVLKDWKPYKDGIWECDFPHESKPEQVFENNRRMNLARKPDGGYFNLEKPVEDKDRTEFIYREGDLKPHEWDISDARVFIWPNHDWFSANVPLANIDGRNRVITLAEQVNTMKPGNRFYVQNVLSLLDKPGECQISWSKKKIYILPNKNPVSQQNIVASTVPNVISIQGNAEHGLVRNLHFEGLDLCISNDHVVNITGAENCSIRFCKVENGYNHGMSITGHAQNINVYGNLIRFNGYHGVSINGLRPGQPDVNKYNVVENNHIHHCGRLVGHGYGVNISQSGHNKIIHNHIHHMPRYATTIKGVRYQVLRKQIEGITWENRHDFLHSRHNLIAYNNIHHVNEDSQDTGAMESWGPGRDNVYDHNLIQNVGNDMFNLQMGIYLDDATDYFTVTNNIIYGVVGTNRTQPIYAKGIGNKIINNILIISPENDAAISSLYMAEERADKHVYTHNIYYFEGSGGAIYDFYNWSDDRVAASDYNILWKPRGELTMAGKCPAKTFEEWKKILGGKYDQNSIVADP